MTARTIAKALLPLMHDVSALEGRFKKRRPGDPLPRRQDQLYIAWRRLSEARNLLLGSPD